MNTELLKKIREHILEEPKRYDQGAYHKEVSTRTVACGTQACIAGWAVLLSGINIESARGSYDGIRGTAERLLDLSDDESTTLFCGSGEDWPEPYQTQFRKARSKAAQAEVAGRYLNRVIRTRKVS